MSRFEKKSVEEVNDMTMTEFYCLTYARSEQDVYREYLMHKQAFVNREVEAKKNVGTKKKPEEQWIFKDFNSFFDYEKAIEDLKNFNTESQKAKDKNQPTQKEVAERIAEFNKRKSEKNK